MSKELQEFFKSKYKYCKDTGKLFHKEDANHVYAGMEVGMIKYNKNRKKIPYRSVAIKSKQWQVHRIIWIMNYGKLARDLVIDHINGDTLDNRLENLRVTTCSGNQKNRKLNYNSSTGYSGIYLDKYGKYQVQIYSENVKMYLGRFKTLEEAVKVRKEAEKEYNYHGNHGRKTV